MEVDGRVVSLVRDRVALGEQSWAEIVADAAAHLPAEVDPSVARALARQIVDVEFAAHLAAQADWPAETDNDRLTLAFRALDGAGIVAREDFACCQRCGLNDIDDEVDEGAAARGYAFYHRQDTAHAAAGSGVHIAYGTFEEASAEIGEEVAAALREHGLPVDWDGDPGTRIHAPLTWRRRRAGRLAAMPALVDVDVEVDVEVDVDVTVEGESPGGWPRGLAPVRGPISAAELAGLHLPWLPARTRLRIVAAGGAGGEGMAVTVRRERHALVGEFVDPAVSDLTVGRHHGMDLVRRLVGTPVDPAPVEPEPGLLEVTYEHPDRRQDSAVPMGLAESIELLRRMPPWTGAWVCYEGASGGILRMRWEQGVLRLESPHTDTSRGRPVDLAEAARLLTALSTEDRAADRPAGEDAGGAEQ